MSALLQRIRAWRERRAIWRTVEGILCAGVGHPNDAVQLAAELHRQLHELDLSAPSFLARDRGGPQE